MYIFIHTCTCRDQFIDAINVNAIKKTIIHVHISIFTCMRLLNGSYNSHKVHFDIWWYQQLFHLSIAQEDVTCTLHTKKKLKKLKCVKRVWEKVHIHY